MKLSCDRSLSLKLAMVVGIVMAAGIACQAQTWALCYTQAASAGSRLIQGLRRGILVLVIPPMFMSVGITVMAYRKRNQFGSAADRSDKNEW